MWTIVAAGALTVGGAGCAHHVLSSREFGETLEMAVTEDLKRQLRFVFLHEHCFFIASVTEPSDGASTTDAWVVAPEETGLLAGDDWDPQAHDISRLADEVRGEQYGRCVFVLVAVGHDQEETLADGVTALERAQRRFIIWPETLVAEP
jgi:hypothetical protein